MQQSENISKGLDKQSLSLDFLLCLIFLKKPLISTTPQKDALIEKNFPSFYLKYLGWFMIMDKFTKYSKLRS